ncbi:DUF4831 family protein [Porphyromonas sp.]|uniref:DUF4831 family protein n=1 Tax=Porphyromonas sp. TaxID=1924944 RepID=UPI0026DBD04A|nr:DUF4831 family protein [Porphyromonas sp.]MDO4771910.1 DUF4831 family protein [Porphyromonas sp.]
MYKYILTALTLIMGVCTSYAQSRVQRYDITEGDNNSVVYALPLTRLYVTVTVEEEVTTPGEFALYAEKYLGIKTVPMQPTQTFRIKEIKMGAYGVPNPEQRYTVQFKSNSAASYLQLTQDGILCAINSEYIPLSQMPEEKMTDFETEEAIDRLSSMSEEYVQATTKTKQAEITAREIFRIRESRTSIVSGEAEQPFPDGQAMKLAISGLDKQEKALTERFVGKVKVRTRTFVIRNLSAEEEGRTVAFRFSEALGLLDKADLRGEPVYLNIKVLDRAPELTEKEAARKAKSLKGIIYTVPGKIRASLSSSEGKSILSGDYDIAQLGTQEALNPALFTAKKGRASLILNPETGSIRQVKETN